tara:strand:- start:92 stop:823 length:732 start_codon:yes stop_codon:yes gene_type:complete
MKNGTIALLTLIFCIGISSEEGVEQDQKGDKSENVIKFFSTVLRSLLNNSNADEFFKIYKDSQYFLCQGKGTLSMSIPEFNAEEKAPMRDQVLIAFQDEPENLGLLAVSHPAQLGEGWLVVSFKPLTKPRKWINVWDTENGFDPTPMNDKIKGTVNAFVLEINVTATAKDFGEDWKPGPMAGSFMRQKYSRIRINVNRKTNEFFLTISEKMDMKISLPSGEDYVSDAFKEEDIEGTCSLTNRS